jgi:hypothetical protein
MVRSNRCRHAAEPVRHLLNVEWVHVFKLLLISIVIVPVLVGIRASRTGRGSRGLGLLLASVLMYDALYWLMLYYLRTRWVGWGSG